MIAGKKADEETRHQEEREPSDQKHASNKSPLFADRSENIVVVHGCSRKEAKFDLCIWRLEALARPTARSDSDKRLVDRPGGALFVNIGMRERSDPLLLIRFKTKIDGDRDESDSDEDQAK